MSGTAAPVPRTAAQLPENPVESAFGRFGDALYRYVFVRTGGNADLSADVMQQVWVQACGADLGRIVEDDRERWLRRVAKNVLITHWRTARRRPQSVPLVDVELAAALSNRLATEEIPPTLLTRKEVRDQLLLAITQLSTDDQQVIVGHYFSGHSHALLADELGLSVRAVEGRLYRARASLRAALLHLDG